MNSATSPTPEEELESCPVCGALPIDQVDNHAVRELVRNPYKLSRQEILDDCSSRREVLEEAARVADKHYQDSKKSAAYYKSLPDDDGSYGQCLADMIVAGDIAIAIRALAGEK